MCMSGCEWCPEMTLILNHLHSFKRLVLTDINYKTLAFSCTLYLLQECEAKVQYSSPLCRIQLIATT